MSRLLPPSLSLLSFSSSPLSSCSSSSFPSVAFFSFLVRFITVLLSGSPFPSCSSFPQFSSSVLMCVLYFLLSPSVLLCSVCLLSFSGPETPVWEPGAFPQESAPCHSPCQAVLSARLLPASGPCLLPRRLPSGFWGILSSSWEAGL